MVPKAKPVAPKAGLTGVPKLGAAVVVAVLAAAPKLKGAGAEEAVAAGVDEAPPVPKVKEAFGGAAEEPKVDCVAGASNAGFPKGKVDWVVEVGAAEEVVLAIAKPPNEAVVVFWLVVF